MDTMFDGIGSNCDAYWKCEVAKMRKMNIPTGCMKLWKSDS